MPIRAYYVGGVNHFSVLAPVTELLAKKIVDPSGDVAVTEAELNAAVAGSRTGRR